jgi:hypothetical protein
MSNHLVKPDGAPAVPKVIPPGTVCPYASGPIVLMANAGLRGEIAQQVGAGTTACMGPACKIWNPDAPLPDSKERGDCDIKHTNRVTRAAAARQVQQFDLLLQGMDKILLAAGRAEVLEPEEAGLETGEGESDGPANG